jgi:hypothetical protein
MGEIEIVNGSLEARVRDAVEALSLSIGMLDADGADGRVRSALEGVLRLLGYRVAVAETEVWFRWVGTVSRSLELGVSDAHVVAKMRDSFDGNAVMGEADWESVKHPGAQVSYVAEVEVGGPVMARFQAGEAEGLYVGYSVAPHTPVWDIVVSRLPWDMDVESVTVTSVSHIHAAVPLE